MGIGINTCVCFESYGLNFSCFQYQYNAYNGKLTLVSFKNRTTGEDLLQKAKNELELFYSPMVAAIMASHLSDWAVVNGEARFTFEFTNKEGKVTNKATMFFNEKGAMTKAVKNKYVYNTHGGIYREYSFTYYYDESGKSHRNLNRRIQREEGLSL